MSIDIPVLQMVLAMPSDFYVPVWLLGELEVNSKQHLKASVSGAELEQEMGSGSESLRLGGQQA